MPLGIEEEDSLYDNKSLLQRESLKYDPRIVQALDRIWKTTDSNHNGGVDRDEYIRMSRKLYVALVADDMDEAQRIAEQEWEQDSFG